MSKEPNDKPLEEWEKEPCPVIFGIQLPPLRVYIICGLIIALGAVIFYIQWQRMSGELIPSPASTLSRPSPTATPTP